MSDWAAIFTKEDMRINGGVHTLPYILFTLAMITGRLFVHKLFDKFTMQRLVTLGALVSGISFLVGLATVHLVNSSNKVLILFVLCFSFTFAGLGSSFLAPSIMNIANVRSNSPASVVIGQMGVINNIAIFFVRLIIAWTAQATSLTIALVIPASMLLLVPFFAKIFPPSVLKT